MNSVSSQAAPGSVAGQDVTMSQQQASHSQRTSMTEGVVEGQLLDYMLTLLLQCSTRLRDLEATNYYTHVIPTNSLMFKTLDDVYQGYLYMQENKEHTLGPPMIHRGIAMLEQVLKAQEGLKEKEGLKDMWPVVAKAVPEIKASDMDIEGAASIIGHCKVYSMHDKTNSKLVFVLPHIVECHGRVTTLGSVVSRLLRSMVFERKTGVAPPGFLEPHPTPQIHRF